MEFPYLVGVLIFAFSYHAHPYHTHRRRREAGREGREDEGSTRRQLTHVPPRRFLVYTVGLLGTLLLVVVVGKVPAGRKIIPSWRNVVATLLFLT